MKKLLNIHKLTLYSYKYMLVFHYERFQTKFSAMAFVPPVILLWKKSQLTNAKLFKHECIHHRQMLELGILPFYIWYFAEYLIDRMKGFSHLDAYLNISFEQEAYYGEDIKNYASQPRWYGFLKYIKLFKSLLK